MPTAEYLQGRDRPFGNHIVCTTCGAMIDGDYRQKHDEFHKQQ